MAFTELKFVKCAKCGYEYMIDSIRKSCPLCAVIHITPLKTPMETLEVIDEESGHKYYVDQPKQTIIPEGNKRLNRENYGSNEEFNRVKAYVQANNLKAKDILELSRGELKSIIEGC